MTWLLWILRPVMWHRAAGLSPGLKPTRTVGIAVANSGVVICGIKVWWHVQFARLTWGCPILYIAFGFPCGNFYFPGSKGTHRIMALFCLKLNVVSTVLDHRPFMNIRLIITLVSKIHAYLRFQLKLVIQFLLLFLFRGVHRSKSNRPKRRIGRFGRLIKRTNQILILQIIIFTPW